MDKLPPDFFVELANFLYSDEIKKIRLLSKELKDMIDSNEKLWHYLIKTDCPFLEGQIIKTAEKYKMSIFQLYYSIKIKAIEVNGNTNENIIMHLPKGITGIAIGMKSIVTILNKKFYIHKFDSKYLKRKYKHPIKKYDGDYNISHRLKNKRASFINISQFNHNHIIAIANDKFFYRGSNTCYMPDNNVVEISFPDKVTAASIGGKYCAVISGNMLYVCGQEDNYYYPYKYGNNYSKNTYFKKIPKLINVTLVVCGGAHIIFVSDGKLYGIGRNIDGQLGLGNYNNSSSPSEIQKFHNIQKIACGREHTAIISNNKLYMFGSNEYGQLGLGEINNTNLPTEITSLKNVTDVVCGENDTFVIADNKLYGFGYNNKNKIKNGSIHGVKTPFHILTLQNPLFISTNEFTTFVVTWKINAAFKNEI